MDVAVEIKTAKQFIDYLMNELGFWPTEDEMYMKNIQSLSVQYLLIKIIDEAKAELYLRNEKTLIGDVKNYDTLLETCDISDSKLPERIKELLNENPESKDT